MTDTERVEIAWSKAKLIKLLIFSVLFLLAGLWLAIRQPEIRNSFFNSPIMKNLAAYGGTIMGAAGIYFFSKRLIDKRPGLIIDENGITDNSSAFSFGLIPWSDIAQVYEFSIQASIASRPRFITVELHDPEKYISRETNSFKRNLLLLNLKNYGSPVHISTNGLEINPNDLLGLISHAFNSNKMTATGRIPI